MPRKTEDGFPDDVEIDILIRLPVKSLLRFRCVCKPWCARFQSPDFINIHHFKQTSLHNNANVSVLVRGHNRSAYLKPPYFSVLNETLSFKEHMHIPLLKGYICNGLICLWDRYKKIILCNPAAREFMLLPTLLFEHAPYIRNTTLHNIGFGFDSKTNDYKVIYCVHLYTLSTNSWRKLPTVYRDFGHPRFQNDIYINGVYHWEAKLRKFIVTFDMANEVFSTLPLPFDLSYRTEYAFNLALLNESLAATIYPYKAMWKRFNIWVMKEYGVKESWTKQLTVEPIPGVARPLGFWKNSGLFLESSDQQLILGRLRNFKFILIGKQCALLFLWRAWF